MPLLLVLLWAASLPRHAQAVHDLVVGLVSPQGLALDLKASRMYWVEAGIMKLRRANLDGSGATDVVVKDTEDEAPYDVALDGGSGKVYWTSRCCGVRRATLEGQGEELVVNSTDAGGIALDVPAGLLFWTDRTTGRLWRANLNGSGKDTIVPGGLSTPVDVAVDNLTGKVYWVDVGRTQVERANFDGSARQTVNVSYTISKSAQGIALDTVARKIYVTDYQSDANGYKGRIIRAQMDGDQSEILIQDGVMKMPFSIALDHEGGTVFWTDQRAGKIQSLVLRCPAGNLSIGSSTNSSLVRVPYRAMDHGGLQEARCPAGYSGEVSLTCNDGSVSLNSGQCARGCPRGSIKQAGRFVVYHGDMLDGSHQGGRCGPGLTGPVQLLCSDGEVSVFSGSCTRPAGCKEGRFLVSNAVVEHPAIAHGNRFDGSCPAGFNGSFALQCTDGTVSILSGSCLAPCTAGRIWVDEGRVEISHTPIHEGFTPLRVRCPAGSAGDGVFLACDDATLQVIKADCTKIKQCVGGNVSVHGVQVRHGGMEDGSLVQARCPEGYSGIVNVTCREGTASAAPSAACWAHCAAGLVEVGPEIWARHAAGRHGEALLAACPGGYAGSVPLRCYDGNVSLTPCQESGCTCRPCSEFPSPVGPCRGGAQKPTPAKDFLAPTPAPDPLAPGPARDFLVPALAVPFLAVLCLIAGMSVYHWHCKGRYADAVGADPAGAAVGAGPLDRSRGADGRVRPNEVFEAPPAPPLPSVRLPPYWATREGAHIFPDPNRMDEMQRLMSETWRACYTRDRRLVAGEHRVPSGCRVANVLRIENCDAYERYWQHRTRVGERRCTVGCEPFRTQTTGKLNCLDSSLNETYLFHGTNPDAAHAIARDLFRIDKAGSCGGAMFGPGIYLAENASKSDEYAKEGSGVYVGLCAMLVCRAVLGRVLTVSGAGDCSARVLSGEYDCVCGDRLAAAGTFRELVFFREESVYAEFIVIYARIYGDD